MTSWQRNLIKKFAKKVFNYKNLIYWHSFMKNRSQGLVLLKKEFDSDFNIFG